MTNEKLIEILETKRLLDNANWLLKKLKEIDPVESIVFHGKEENTSVWEPNTVNDVIEMIKIAKEELETMFDES